MEIKALRTLHCDAGWRNYHFVQIEAADGTLGYSEYDEGFGSPGITTVIESMQGRLVGRDPMQHERLYQEMLGATPTGLRGGRRRGHRRHRKRASRPQRQAVGCALLRALGWQGA